MWEMFQKWYRRRFSDPQALGLFAILLFIFVAIYFFSDIIAPLLIALVLAYLLEAPIRLLSNKLKLPRPVSVSISLLLFAASIIFILVVLLPRLWTQTISLAQDLPTMINQLHHWLLTLPEHYPGLIDYPMLDSLFSNLRTKLLAFGESALRYSLSSLLSLVTIGIYAFLVPLMVFFLVKDKQVLIEGVLRFMPRNRTLASQVWREMQTQISNYIRGKFLEIIVVGAITYVLLLFFDLRYPLLLAFGVGLSVLVPYVGAVLITIPIMLVALVQFGITPTFWYLMLGYIIIQILDGNLLVPILFSEAVNLHPLIIILAVLIFGGLWGFWGVFFAIPLATLVKAVVNAWPSNDDAESA
ncbi:MULTISPECIES: AI-2E family transporter [Testudinibacter]|uniref:AI-2E family transporter n=1 Tax=Testudinibacter aquarius TaxID=1524974 RepID=A0A4R3Y8L6_9PAST|nr:MULTISPECIES: AI-2E family transporter [Testudinibacter]TNG92303.1 AI-2E family transporter [Pasteurellaceae bacterium USgator41]TNG93890.1 AI-2E family transporter [Pasteurellaceae bacterium UScroc12]TNG96203.1 AI-2E family transporter [Pasteurellaceae bacterium UScroc31]TNH02124.1 AI-2E family transporter [Pasteurellaceae bacterium USgator11]TNH08308.1 AI-2E family transporter [Pasteurellaceae bacterium Phil11]